MTTAKTPEAPNAAAAAAVTDAAAVAAAAGAAADTPQSYEDAFAEITADEPLGGKAKVKTPEELALEAKAKEPPEEGAAPDASVEDAAAATAAASAAAAAATAPDPAAELATARARIVELEAAAKAAPTAAAVAATVAAAAAAATTDGKPAVGEDGKPATTEDKIEWYAPTADEKAVLEQHAKDWPDVAAAQAIHTKAAVWNAMQFIFKEIRTNYNPVIDRFKEMAEAMEGQLALTEIRVKNADYDTIRENVVKWIDTLPAFAKNGAKEIMETGTPEEVSEIIAEYRKANPTAAAGTAPAAAAATPAVPAAKQTVLTDAAKKAAGKLTVVDSKRTTQAVAPDPNDFEAAWKEASAAG